MNCDALMSVENIPEINEILEITAAAVYSVNADWRLIYLNRSAENHLHRTRDALVGSVLWDVFPNIKTTPVYEYFLKVMREREPMRSEAFVPELNTWVELNICPLSSGGLAVSFYDITQRKQTEEAHNNALLFSEKAEEVALELVKELRRADDNKNEFLSMLSHEVRNPLACISIALSVLEHVAPDSEKAIRTREIMKRQTEQLTHLVDELLDMTRITHNIIELKKEHVELNELLSRSVDDFRIQFEKKGIDLEVMLPSDSICLEADPVRVTQVIGNLLHNTVKFTDKGGKALLKLSIDKRRREAAIVVQDNGRGIRAEHLPDIFKPFVQLNDSRDRSKGGLGLGLAIVKGIVELHGWSITALSDGLKKGTQFVISLPLPTVLPDSPEAEEEICNPSLNRLRVMIVDDNTDLTDIIGTLLEYFGYEVTAVSNGNDALEKAKESHPDVILCDIGLPGMDGYAVARAIRNKKEFDGIYLIALSGYALTKDIERSLDAGFNKHIVKPVNIEELQKILQIENDRIDFAISGINMERE